MLVYADRPRTISPAAHLKAIAAGAAGDRAQSLTDAFVLASELAQGLTDAEFAARGFDDMTPIHRASLALLRDLARRLRRQDFAPFENPFAGIPLPSAVQVRTAEGFAHYAVYPEAFLAAGRRLKAATVIGLRSIGAGLAALVAAACGAERLVSLRPVGEPFQRRLAIAPALQAALLAEPEGGFALVDEGPGQSGSSLAAVAQWLIARGVAAERITLVPSHGGEPGPAADPAVRAVWREVRRVSVDFDALYLGPTPRDALASWFEDLTGPAVAPLQDLSGGAWRAGRRDAPPAHAAQERRKFLLRTEKGRFLLKFAGLGPAARGKLDRARALHSAGFCPETIALRRGVLLERWLDGEPGGMAAPADAARIGAYLGYRAEHFPAPPGASLSQLAAMAEQNLAEALGRPAALAALAPFPVRRLAALACEARPVLVDARLHRWEWLRIDGRLIKTDALDHGDGHDLVGAQDIAWDVAGAAVEFDLDDAGLRRLIEAMPARTRPSGDLVALMRVGYLGFQLGLWTFAAAAAPRDAGVAAELGRYRRAASMRFP